MTIHSSISPRHVNSYHQSNSLIFQFILIEFVETFSEIQRLDSLSNLTPTFSPSDEPTPQRRRESYHPQMETSLNKLVGATKHHMRLFSWNYNEGILTRLRTYCALFVQNSDGEEKELIAIQHYADKIWHHCLHAIDILHQVPQERTDLKITLDKANAAMQRLAKLIARLIHQFRDDENVMFYIVRHHKAFDTLYGNRFVAKLLCRIYPKGLREIQQFLIKKYKERGFETLLGTIYGKIAEIEVSSA